jgi:hypothetical protein
MRIYSSNLSDLNVFIETEFLKIEKMKLYTLFIVFFVQTNFWAQNQNISNGNVFDGEPYLAINPMDQSKMVAAWMGFQLGQQIAIKTAYSTNGGTTWNAGPIIPHQVAGNNSADVSLAYNKVGELFMAYIDYDASNFTNGAVFLRKSIDNGLNWADPVEVISILDCPDQMCVDRPWMAIDTSSGTYSGYIYITTMNADQPNVVAPYHPYISISSDNGNSFQTPKVLDGVGYLSGSVIKQPVTSPVVTKDGTLFVSYPSFVVSQSLYAKVYAAKSVDGGSTLDYVEVLQASSGVVDEFAKLGPLLMTNPTNANHLAYLGLDDDSGDIDVMLTESLDGGLTWSNLEKVNQDPIQNGNLQDLVWGNFDANGNLVVTWRDRRVSQQTGYQQASEIWACIRKAGASDFSPEFKVSSQTASHHSILDGKGNDFMHVQLKNDTMYAIWGDVRTGILTIWLSRISIQDGTSSVEAISSFVNVPVDVFPNPVHETFQLTNVSQSERFTLLSMEGTVIIDQKSYEELQNEVKILTKGVYFLWLNQSNRMLQFEKQ